MNLRRLTPNDTEKIAELEQQIFPDPWTQRDIDSAVCNECGMCFCVEGDGGEILAYVIGRIIAPEGEIYRIATREDKRGRGIAYRLLDYAVRQERENGLESLFLEVRRENKVARRLYSSYGFVEIGERKNYYKNPTDDAIIMALLSE